MEVHFVQFVKTKEMIKSFDGMILEIALQKTEENWFSVLISW